ncbi:unnamed protein product [Protopolystoma xenopodis]|uniref:Uncharacterized protein n=1 Tax=Protopolystoma xenopodis TaxID=117903 RepID=A0A448XKR2_9PLAT|nr:unnamed protein product [Protopolystoma xenopodis]
MLFIFILNNFFFPQASSASLSYIVDTASSRFSPLPDQGQGGDVGGSASLGSFSSTSLNKTPVYPPEKIYFTLESCIITWNDSLTSGISFPLGPGLIQQPESSGNCCVLSPSVYPSVCQIVSTSSGERTVCQLVFPDRLTVPTRLIPASTSSGQSFASHISHAVKKVFGIFNLFC